MSETILYLIAGVLILGVLRSIIGVVLKGVGDFFSTPSSPSAGTGQAGTSARGPSIPPAEALKKDPVCGTYLAPSSAIQKTVGGKTYYFCSAECRDKFRPVPK
ncbi:MAG TPA: YHS domain-containing protein [Bryobacteraceae bacterium]